MVLFVLMLIKIIVLSVLLGAEALAVAPLYFNICPSMQKIAFGGDEANAALFMVGFLKIFALTSVNLIVYFYVSKLIYNKFSKDRFGKGEVRQCGENVSRFVIALSYGYSVTRTFPATDDAAVSCTWAEYFWAWCGFFLFLVFVEHVVLPLSRFVYGVLVPRRPAFTGRFAAQTGARLAALLGILVLTDVVWVPRYIGFCSSIDFDPMASAGMDERIGGLIGEYLISVAAGVGAYVFIIRNILKRSSVLARDAVFGGVSADVLLKVALGAVFVVGLGPFHEEATAVAMLCLVRNCALFTLKLFVTLAVIEHLVLPVLTFAACQLAIRRPPTSQP